MQSPGLQVCTANPGHQAKGFSSSTHTPTSCIKVFGAASDEPGIIVYLNFLGSHLLRYLELDLVLKQS